MFSNAEAIAADQQQIDQVGFGLWSRDTPFGSDGYLTEYAYDPIVTSHTVLTTEGIRGRDTVAGAAASAQRGPSALTGRPTAKRLPPGAQRPLGGAPDAAGLTITHE